MFRDSTKAWIESPGAIHWLTDGSFLWFSERDDWGNGAFTKAIVEGIELGKADLLGKGFITTSSLDTFVESRVAELTEGKQSPVMERPPQQPDFAIAEAHKR